MGEAEYFASYGQHMYDEKSKELDESQAEIARLQADVDFLMKDNMGMREAILSAQEEADTAWNDAIDAAARVYENGGVGDSWDYFQDAYDAIRALRKETK